MPLADTIDLTPFGEHAPLVMFYLKHVDEVHELDSQLGDKAAKGADFINSLKEQHPDAVAEAEQIIKSITENTDLAKRAIVVFMLTRNRDFSRLATDYIAANQPKEEEQNQDVAALAELWAKRSNAQKQAAFMYKGLELADFPKEVFDILPTPPEGKKGVAPGQKRGQQGRHLPSPVSWTVTTSKEDGTTITEDHGKQTGAQIAKICGVKSTDIRLAVEKAYPDSTPNEFTVTVGNKTIVGKVVTEDGAAPTEDTDDSDNDEINDDLGELDFED